MKLVTGGRTKRADRPHMHKNEPKPSNGEPDMPDHLSPGAEAAWRLLAPRLLKMGVLTVADGVALERLCECYAQVRELQDKLTLRGDAFYQSRGANGAIMHRAYPEVSALSDADNRLRRYLAEFGLTPAARSRVGATPGTGDTDDAAERFFG